ncbi:Mitochondrial transcription factor 1 [Savitreella phatthalungensis]
MRCTRLLSSQIPTLSERARSISQGLVKQTTLWRPAALRDPEAIQQAVDRSHLRDYAGKGTIIEMNPGPGLLMQHIIEKIKPHRYVALETREQFTPALNLVREAAKALDVDCRVLNLNGYLWDTYDELDRLRVVPYDEVVYPQEAGVNTNICLIASIRDAELEQLLAQWLVTMATKSWIFSLGRVRLYAFVSPGVRQRWMAPVGSPARSRLTVIREGACDIREILHNPWQRLGRSAKAVWQEDISDKPADPAVPRADPDCFINTSDLSLIELTPFATPGFTVPFESFDYVARNLFMNRTTALYKQVRSLASGAYTILRDLPDDLCLKTPSEMTFSDMNRIASAFHNWPFRPRYLHVEDTSTGENLVNLKSVISQTMQEGAIRQRQSPIKIGTPATAPPSAFEKHQ